MKFTTFVAAAMTLAGFVSAQSACEASIEAVPPCANGYFISAAHSIANCGVDDFHCQCSVSQSVQANIAGTVASQCDGGQLPAVLAAQSNLCECASARPHKSIKPNRVARVCSNDALQIPPCGAGYLYSAAYSIGGCAIDDYVCQCSNSANVQGQVAASVASACGGNQIGSLLDAQSRLCACATRVGGVPTSVHPGTITSTSTHY